MWLDRVVRFPLTKIVLGTAAVFGALLATRALIEWLYELLDLVPVRFFSIPAVAAAILAVSVANARYVRLTVRDCPREAVVVTVAQLAGLTTPAALGGGDFPGALDAAAPQDGEASGQRLKVRPRKLTIPKSVNRWSVPPPGWS